jgi:ABC-type Fe3+ transport system substrate-binding protein
MSGFFTGRTISRRSAVQLLSAGALSEAPFVSRLRAADLIESSVEWARKALPHSTPDIVRGAAKEGRLNLTLYNLGGGEEAVSGTIAGFRKRYPFIAVNFSRQDTIQLVSKFNAEVNSRRGISDYVNLPSNMLTSTAFIKQGAIAQFVVSEDAAYPPGSKNSGYWYAWRFEKASTVYRIGALSPEEVKLVRTYQGLADARFKGRLGTTAVNNSVCATAAYMLMYGLNPQLWAGLARNKPFVVKSSSQALVSSILAGECDIGVLCGSSSPLIAAKSGAPIAFGSTSPSATLYTPGAISALAPNPNAARLWQDWFTSAEGQHLWVSLTGNQSVRSGVGQTGWAEKQPWFFDDHRSHQLDWEAFSNKQKEVMTKFAHDIQGA